jgi:hypothetical protein
MRKLILLLLVLFLAFVYYARHRLYVRDPLGTVAHGSPAVKEYGAQVFIDYDNDVLLENDNAPAYITVVQHGNHIGTPVEMKCLHWVLCFADADVVPLLQPLRADVESMTNKEVVYRTRDGLTTVSLR